MLSALLIVAVLVVATMAVHAAGFALVLRSFMESHNTPPTRPCVLQTVIFASVLFFGGIARAFDSRRLRVVLAALAMLLFLGVLVALTTRPICREMIT